MRKITLPLAALLLASLPLAAQEADTHGSVTGVVQGTDDPGESSKFQEYLDRSSGAYVERLTFGLDGTAWVVRLDAERLGRRDRGAQLWARRGGLELRIGFDRSPHWISNTARTRFTELEGVLAASDLTQAVLQSLPAPSLVGPALLADQLTASPVDLRFRRDTTFAEMSWSLSEAFRTGVRVDHEARRGTQPRAVATYFTVGADTTEFAAPTRWDTRDATLSADYATDRWSAGAALRFSEFENDLEPGHAGFAFENAWIVENPLRLTDATPSVPDPLAPLNPAGARFLVAAPMDNRALWLDLDGAMRLGEWGRLLAQLSVGQQRQDELFLPFSLNSAVPLVTADLVPMPVEVRRDGLFGTREDRYDGRVDLTRYDVRLLTNPFPRLDLRAFARSYDYDNRTPEYVVTDYVRGDTDLEGIARAALPFAWKRDRLGIEGRYRLGGRLDVRAGLERETWDRELRAVTETTEDILLVGADWRPAGWGSVHATWRRGDRDIDRYDEHRVAEESFPEGEPVGNAIVPDQRLFDMTERARDRFVLSASLTPGDRVGLGLQVVRTSDDYDETVIGRTSDETTGYGVDLTWDLGDGLALFADWGRDTFDTDIRSRYRPVVAGVAVDDPANEWFSAMEDTTDSYGLGLSGSLGESLEFEAQARRTSSTGRVDNSFVPGGSPTGDAPEWPDVDQDLSSVSLDLRRKVRAGLTVGAGAAYEAWRQTDWARDPMETWVAGIDPGASESVFLGYRFPSYHVVLVRVFATWLF
jgi:MtrB/PioB family decaheme-associated outer membrane protein